jgi:16S rRNA processing protein RimM
MDHREIGYFSKTKGIRGELILRTDLSIIPEELKVVFLEISGSKAPFFIEKIGGTEDAFTVKLEGIERVEDALKLKGKKVFADALCVAEEEVERDLKGYELIDGKHGSLGKIIGMDTSGPQVLITVVYKEKEVILPLVNEFVTKVEHRSKKLYYEAPEGLLEIYLG